MAFWGVEVKPGKPYRHRGRLRISQAVLGNVVSAKGAKPNAKTVVQCNVGTKRPVLICSLFVDKYEMCLLGLEFTEQEEVMFSVLGQRSVHLCGYYVGPREYSEEPFGEDIAETESEESDYNDFSDEDKYDSDFIDDSEAVEVHDYGDTSHPCKSKDVIEEILEEERAAIGEKRCLAKKKNCQASDSDSDDAANDSNLQFAVKGEN